MERSRNAATSRFGRAPTEKYSASKVATVNSADRVAYSLMAEGIQGTGIPNNISLTTSSVAGIESNRLPLTRDSFDNVLMLLDTPPCNSGPPPGSSSATSNGKSTINENMSFRLMALGTLRALLINASGAQENGESS